MIYIVASEHVICEWVSNHHINNKFNKFNWSINSRIVTCNLRALDSKAIFSLSSKGNEAMATTEDSETSRNYQNQQPATTEATKPKTTESIAAIRRRRAAN